MRFSLIKNNRKSFSVAVQAGPCLAKSSSRSFKKQKISDATGQGGQTMDCAKHLQTKGNETDQERYHVLLSAQLQSVSHFRLNTWVDLYSGVSLSKFSQRTNWLIHFTHYALTHSKHLFKRPMINR